MASIYRAWSEGESSPLRHRVTYVPSRSAGRPFVHRSTSASASARTSSSPLLPLPPSSDHFRFWRPPSRAKNNFDQSPARRLITPSLVKGAPPFPRVNIFLLHHRISTRVLFQCSNGELWWSDTGDPGAEWQRMGGHDPEKGGLISLEK